MMSLPKYYKKQNNKRLANFLFYSITCTYVRLYYGKNYAFYDKVIRGKATERRIDYYSSNNLFFWFAM